MEINFEAPGRNIQKYIETTSFYKLHEAKSSIFHKLQTHIFLLMVAY